MTPSGLPVVSLPGGSVRILDAARAKKGRPIHMRLAEELLDAYRRQGGAYQRRENTHKMAEANRDFSHFSRR